MKQTSKSQPDLKDSSIRNLIEENVMKSVTKNKNEKDRKSKIEI